MKKFIVALVAMVTMTFTTASAMSYEQARQQALFLTDKMAYELNLTEDQYEAAYETNLDYLMSVNTVDDLYGVYWRQRNMDLSYILLDWQYRTFLNANYFYRPLYWDGGFWHFGIYARYPHRDYFFFGRPNFFVSYRGGHSWRMNGGRSWYHGRDFGGPRPGGQPRMGMRDGFNRGDFGRGQSFGNMNRNNAPQFGNGNRPQNVNGRPQNNMNSRPQNNAGFGNQSRSFGNRQSSTRTTVTRDNMNNSKPSNGAFGSNRTNVFGGNRGGSSFGSGSMNRNFGSGSSTRSFGGNSTSAPAKSFTPRSTPSNSGSFGSGTRSFGGSRSNGGSSFGGGSFGGGSHSNGGGSHGGGSFGGRR